MRCDPRRASSLRKALEPEGPRRPDRFARAGLGGVPRKFKCLRRECCQPRGGEEGLASRRRREWAGSDPGLLGYHDTERGTPEHDHRKLVEVLILEGARAGLSWVAMLRKAVDC